MRGLLLLLQMAALTLGLNYDNLLETFPLVAINGTPDSDLMEDLATFVSDGGVRRVPGTPRGGARRGYHDYIMKEENVYKDKIMDLMKQVLYAAQEHMRGLAAVLAKYRGDPGFRMRFIFNKLQQYTVDMRRIYTLAVKGGDYYMKMSEHLRLYQHLARKHIDVIYVVDHVIAAHERYMAPLLAREADLQTDREPSADELLVTRDPPGPGGEGQPPEGGRGQYQAPDGMEEKVDAY